MLVLIDSTRKIYQNVLTGLKGRLSEQVFTPSMRRLKRGNEKVHSSKISKYTEASKSGNGYRKNRFSKIKV
jgi:hypothetical protein